MNKLIILTMCLFLSGCSFLPKLSFNRTTSALPQATSKSDTRIQCKGDIILDSMGRVQSCSNGYYARENHYNQAEQKLTFFDRIGSFFANLRGWFGIAILVSVVLSFMGLGGLVVSVWTNLFGTAKRAAQSLVNGISRGKKYVRENGTKYTLEQKEIYNQGANDVLAKIAEETDNPKIKKLINRLRAENG